MACVCFRQVKLVNINIPDIIDGRPSIVLGLIWTIILHCHVGICMELSPQATCLDVQHDVLLRGCGTREGPGLDL